MRKKRRMQRIEQLDTIPKAQIILELEDELVRRKTIYPKLIEKEVFTKAEARSKMDRLCAAIQLIRRLDEQ